MRLFNVMFMFVLVRILKIKCLVYLLGRIQQLILVFKLVYFCDFGM